VIESPFAVALALLAIVGGLFYAEKKPRFARLFHFLPLPFWCYFIPVLLATFSILPNESVVYRFLTTYGLAACLILLLLSVNLPAILRLGPTALGTMAVGIIGIGTGAVVSYSIFHGAFHPEMWKGVGALSASWTGGSANMLAVKEGLNVPDAIFAPMVIVDTVITYSWMALLIALAPLQTRWDVWVGADRRLLDEAIGRAQTTVTARQASPWHATWMIPLGLAIGALCLMLGRQLPTGSAINANGWAFLVATAAGIALSLTPAARLEQFGASRSGYFFLYLLLAAIGARARLQDILQAPFLLAMAVVWVGIHAAILFAWGRWRRLPLFFLVAASQANIGGTASAPIVAGLYQPALASVGLLLAISANIIGTYLGIGVALLCRSLR